LLQGGNIFVPDGKPSWTGIVLNVIVINTGAPSIAVDWGLSIIPATNAPARAQLTKIPRSLVARGQVGSSYVSESESLVESTLNDPLETDVPRSGKLLFYVVLPQNEVKNSVLELSVTDANGRPFMVRQDIKDWLHN
jgi:hypothetical protein